MLFSVIGIITGIILNFFLFMPQPGLQLTPEFHAGLDSLEKIEKPGSSDFRHQTFSFVNNNAIYILNDRGELVAEKHIDDGLISLSGSGAFYIKYRKVGREIDLYNIKGERFWKKKSLEYTYLSYNGKMILLLNGDHSRVRVFDYNGSNIVNDHIYGRFCTSISFSKDSDFGGLGFLDGSYFILSHKKGILFKGKVPEGKIIKGISISRSSLYAAVHYGDKNSDFIRIVNPVKNSFKDKKLKKVHTVKTAFHITDNGVLTVLETGHIMMSNADGDILFKIIIPPKKEGHSRLSYNYDLYAATYTMKSAGSKIILFKNNGSIIFSKEFPGETYLDNEIKGNFIFLRGSKNIYCYSYR